MQDSYMSYVHVEPDLNVISNQEELAAVKAGTSVREDESEG